ncbi:MAG TPA: magnesium chelatase ATPase subunit I [Pyrinomonadaceae bacterium]
MFIIPDASALDKRVARETMIGHPTSKIQSTQQSARTRVVYPFSAIVGQEEMKLALLLNAIAPTVGGVLVMGERGTAKSTAVRAVADLLPSIKVVRGCAYNCDPQDSETLCGDCRAKLEGAKRLPAERAAAPLVELPLGATEDRVCGTIDVEQVLRDGVRAFEPGLLARANRGFLYVDEVNLLEDHLVDLLLDVSVTGTNKVEREGVSLEHPSRFVLVGSGNPEEGELRPQLLDRFGLFTEVRTVSDVDERVEIVERCERFAADPSGFVEAFGVEQESLRRRIARARRTFASVKIGRPLLRKVAELCARLGVDGHRGELTIVRAGRALAAFEGRREVAAEDVQRVAGMALRHRLRRDPMEQTQGGARIEDELEELLDGADAGATESKSSKQLTDDSGGATEQTDRAAGSDSTDEPRGERGGEQGRAPRGKETVIPSEPASLTVDSFTQLPTSSTRAGKGKATPSRRHSLAGKSVYSTRGRYAGATQAKTGAGVLAIDATVRESAVRAVSRREGSSSAAVRVRVGDLRYKRFRSREGTLFIFAVDTSGSMAANRIGQAKGALAHLLRRSYVKRDRVALVCFREEGAEILMRPSAAASRAGRILEALPVGGATPLPAGLRSALDVALKAVSDGARRVVLVLFTDGRANVPFGGRMAGDRAASRAQILSEVRVIGAALRRLDVTSLVVDTSNRFTSGGEAAELATALGGTHMTLPPGASQQELFEALSV